MKGTNRMILLGAFVVFISILSTVAIDNSDADPEPTYVASIGDQYYTTFDEAVSASDGSKPIEILANCVWAGPIDHKTVLINGHNFTITKNTGAYIWLNSHVTIKDVTIKQEGDSWGIPIGWDTRESNIGQCPKAYFTNVIFDKQIFVYTNEEVQFNNCIIDFIQVQTSVKPDVTFTDCTIEKASMYCSTGELELQNDVVFNNTTIGDLELVDNVYLKSGNELDVGIISHYSPQLNGTMIIDGGVLRYSSTSPDTRISLVSGTTINKTTGVSESKGSDITHVQTDVGDGTITIDMNGTATDVSVSVETVQGAPIEAINVFDITIDVQNTGTAIGYTATITLPIDNTENNRLVVRSYDNNWNFIEEHTVLSYDSDSVTFTTTHNTYFVVDVYTAPIIDDEEYPFFPGHGTSQVIETTSNDSSSDNIKLVVAAAAIVVIMLAAVALMVNRNN